MHPVDRTLRILGRCLDDTTDTDWQIDECLRRDIMDTMQRMDPNGDWIGAEAELAGPDGLAYVRQVVEEWTIDILSEPC